MSSPASPGSGAPSSLCVQFSNCKWHSWVTGVGARQTVTSSPEVAPGLPALRSKHTLTLMVSSKAASKGEWLLGSRPRGAPLPPSSSQPPPVFPRGPWSSLRFAEFLPGFSVMGFVSAWLGCRAQVFTDRTLGVARRHLVAVVTTFNQRTSSEGDRLSSLTQWARLGRQRRSEQS